MPLLRTEAERRRDRVPAISSCGRAGPILNGTAAGTGILLGLWGASSKSCRAVDRATHGSAAIRPRTPHTDHLSLALLKLPGIPEPRPTDAPEPYPPDYFTLWICASLNAQTWGGKAMKWTLSRYPSFVSLGTIDQVKKLRIAVATAGSDCLVETTAYS